MIATLVALIAVIPAAPAQAYTYGTQQLWRDFPELRQGWYTGSNLVKLWQRVVHSDVDTGNSCASFVDGQFGPNTYNRTRTWQSNHKIGVDGEVGPQTWGTAHGGLFVDRQDYIDARSGGFGTVRWTSYYYYHGKRYWFFVAGVTTVDHYSYGYYTKTTYEPWEFHDCNGSLITVKW
ncbi:MAG: peptidoglycan-binding protein [Hamadaea sp.]|nr:peptidoglycan-binding protein [Hamadaea sp.]